MTISSAEVRTNAFTENLKDDWIAVDHAGTPIGRSTDEASIRAALPDAAGYFTGSQLDGHAHKEDLPRAALTPVNDALEKVRQQSEGPDKAAQQKVEHATRDNPAVGMPDHDKHKSPASHAPRTGKTHA